VPEIIQFSNYLSYGGTIKPLRDASGVALLPHTVAHRVSSAYVEGRSKTNREEAEAIVSLIAASIEQPEYADKTFGVISMLGDAQALLIEQLLHDRLTPQQYAHHRLLCGNASQFQGDERDVMFLSLVHGPPDDGLLRIVNEGPLDATKKRYNVAASRARDQMWVVHSMDAGLHLKPGDLRLRLIEHARNPVGVDRRIERVGDQAESPFEEAVQKILIAAGYDVVPQWRVGGYRIDMVVQGSGKRLAIECDGDRFHPPEQFDEDMARQAILERLGWTFSRIRGSQFFRDPETAMEPVFARLRELGIEPTHPSAGDDEPREPTELLSRVRRRADELRRIWHGQAEALAAESSSVEPPAAEAPLTGAPTEEAGAAGDEPTALDVRPEVVVGVSESANEALAQPLPDRPRHDAAPAAPKSAPAPPPRAAPGCAVPNVSAQPYVRAACPFGEPAPDRFQSDIDVLRCLFHVAQVEAPVHVDVVMRRTAEYFGIQRIGSQIRERLRRGIDRLARGRVVLRGDFVWLPEQAPSDTPVRGPALEGYLRTIDEIPLEEIAAATQMLRRAGEADHEESLVVALARLFGYGRVSANIRDRLGSVLQGTGADSATRPHEQ
jgi:very-short-patch-repair endonuclease